MTGTCMGWFVLLTALGSVACERTPPDAPVPIVWDREVCAHCRMAIGEPRYAAQLVTAQADVLGFDDVGCLFRYLDQHRPEVHRLWFARDDRSWIAGSGVGFVTGHTTPMGSGLAAVEADLPGALSLDAARQHHRHEEVRHDLVR